LENMTTVCLRLPQIVSKLHACFGGKKERKKEVRCHPVMVCVLYSPPGRGPAAVVRSGTDLDASDAALCASERTQAARGVGRRRHVLANMRKEGVRFLT
jgi:hypothetical protein